MIDTDKKNFQVMLDIVMTNYGRKKLDREGLRYWWAKLEKHDLETVSQAFDSWIDSQSELPTIHDIAALCRPKVTIFARLPSPLNIADNKRHADELKQAISHMVQPGNDYKSWARKIAANPQNFTEASIKFAKETLAHEYGTSYDQVERDEFEQADLL